MKLKPEFGKALNPKVKHHCTNKVFCILFLFISQSMFHWSLVNSSHGLGLSTYQITKKKKKSNHHHQQQKPQQQ